MKTTARLSLGLIMWASSALLFASCHTQPVRDKYRPASGTLTLNLRNGEDAAWFLAHSRPFYRLDNAHATDYVHVEWLGDKGVCFSPTQRQKSFGPIIAGLYLKNPENYYGTGKPIPPRPQTADECDACTGITVPFFTPKSISISASTVNITEGNRDQLFSDPNKNKDVSLSSMISRGFIGYLTRVPAIAEAAGNIVPQVQPDTQFEFAYIRPSNGMKTPGPYSVGPYTTVQFGATFYEWFVLRSRAFQPMTDADGKPANRPVFESRATTRFASTDVALLTTETNTIDLDFDSSNQQVMRVNGEAILSSVTGQPFDRTLLGSIKPNNDPKTMNVLFTEAGVFACVQRITMTF